MKLDRLARMDMAEIAGRSRQEIAKWLDRMGALPSHPGLAPVPPAELYERLPRRFYEGPGHRDTAARVRKRMPEHAEAVLAAAEKLHAGCFDLLGYENLRFGDPLDWHLDPVAGKRAPRRHWSGLRFLDPEVAGDSKVVWELNRHQWFVTLGQAYALTRDERHATAFVRHLQHWMESNPYGMGINWSSSLEAAFRLVSWSWALALFRTSPALGGGVLDALLRGMAQHATHVERYLSHYFAPNTHLTGEALGLLHAAAVLPESRAAARWKRLGTDILVAQAERQILEDGVYFEQSTIYQRYTAEFYLHFLALSARLGIHVPEPVRAAVPRVVDFLMAVRWPNGEGPQIGDADGGWLLPLARREAGDWRAVFSMAAVLFDRADYAWAAGGLAPETLWTLGPSAEAAFDRLAAAPPARPASRLFPTGGYAVMRGGWEADAHQLIVDAGPLGCGLSCGHGHADLLSIQCAAFGQPVIADPGTYVYTADRGWRDFFRGSEAHAVVLVDGRGQAQPAGPFSWREKPQATLLRWSSSETCDLLAAEHGAYASGEDPVTHRRTVVFAKPDLWLLFDELYGAALHDFELRFPFAPLPVDRSGDWVRAHLAGGRGLWMRSFASCALTTTLASGHDAPRAGWFSTDYGRCVPSPMAIVRGRARLPLRIVTLLLPVKDVHAAPPSVAAGDEDAAGPRRVSIENLGLTIRQVNGTVELTRS